MPATGFDVQAARQAGYSDDEILSHLTQTRKFDVDGAVKSGYSKPEIIQHLSATPAPDATPRGGDQPGFGSRLGEGMLGFAGAAGQGIEALAHPERGPGQAIDLAASQAMSRRPPANAAEAVARAYVPGAEDISQGNYAGAAGTLTSFLLLAGAGKFGPKAMETVKSGARLGTDAAAVARAAAANLTPAQLAGLGSDVLGIVSPRAANAVRAGGRAAGVLERVRQALQPEPSPLVLPDEMQARGNRIPDARPDWRQQIVADQGGVNQPPVQGPATAPAPGQAGLLPPQDLRNPSGTAEPFPVANPQPLEAPSRPVLPSGQSNPIATAAPKTVAQLSQDLNDALAEYGPKPEAKAPVDYPAKARATRSDNAGKLAQLIKGAGISYEDAASLKPGDWGKIASAEDSGVQWPTTPAAQAKLRFEALKKLQSPESQASAAAAPPESAAAPIPDNGVPSDVSLNARIMMRKGYTADYAAKLSPGAWQALGMNVEGPAAAKQIIGEMQRIEAMNGQHVSLPAGAQPATLPTGQSVKPLKLYHGSPETFDQFDPSLSADRDSSIAAWFAKEPRHAAVYGNAEPWEVSPNKVLDLRSYTKVDPATRRPIERNISEWVSILRNKGLDVKMLPDSGVEDQPVPFWDLLAGHDAGSDVATDLPQVLPRSGYDAIRLHEMGLAPDWKPSDTFGIINPAVIQGKSIRK